MSELIRVFINETAVSVPPGGTVSDAVRLYSSEAASALESGRGYVTDGTGRTITLGEPVPAGAILRVIAVGSHEGSD